MRLPLLFCPPASTANVILKNRLPSYYRRLKKYHIQHHYADYENGFGVTSRFWDMVFGTELSDDPKPKKSKVY